MTPAADVTPASIPLSRTPKFKPWLKQLEGQLLDMALKVVQETTGQRVDSGAEDLDEDEIATEQEMKIRREREIGASAYQGEHMENLRRLGGGVGKLVQVRRATEPGDLSTYVQTSCLSRCASLALSRARVAAPR